VIAGDSWVYWMFLALFAGQDTRGWLVPEDGRKPGDPDLEITFDLSINGRSVLFSKVVERLQTTFGDAVDNRAKTIVEETFDNCMEEFEDTVGEVKGKLYEFWQVKLNESRERKMEKALLVIDGLSYLAEGDDPKTLKALIDEIYMISHAASGHCGNPHEDWLAIMEDAIVRLKEMNIVDVDKTLNNEDQDVDPLCKLNSSPFPS